MELVSVLDALERKLHPRQRVGIRWVLWCLVNAIQMFLQFWRYCYGCGTFKGCTCPKDDPFAFTLMDARTAWSVAWVVWKPSWDARPRVVKTSVPKIGLARTREIRNLMPSIIAALRSSVAFEELEASARSREVA